MLPGRLRWAGGHDRQGKEHVSCKDSLPFSLLEHAGQGMCKTHMYMNGLERKRVLLFGENVQKTEYRYRRQPSMVGYELQTGWNLEVGNLEKA